MIKAQDAIAAARALLGGRGKLLLPTAVLLGGAFLMLLDGVVRHTTLNMKVKE